jgi:pyruvate dehydrogenase E1 component alpha subunit
MDPVVVFRATWDAVARARGDGGPAFLEFSTYRFDVHHTFEFRAGLRYRDAEEVARWRARDPTAIRDVMKSER